MDERSRLIKIKQEKERTRQRVSTRIKNGTYVRGNCFFCGVPYLPVTSMKGLFNPVSNIYAILPNPFDHERVVWSCHKHVGFVARDSNPELPESLKQDSEIPAPAKKKWTYKKKVVK